MPTVLRSIIFLLALMNMAQLHAQEKAGSKQVALEADGAIGGTVYIDNVDRKITVKAAVNNRIRLMTTVFYEGKNSLSDTEWFNNLNLELRASGTDIVIQTKRSGGGPRSGEKKKISGTVNEGYDSRNASGTGVARFDSAGQWENRKANINRDLELYIPAGVKVNISSKYADVTIETNLEELSAVINHASLIVYDCKKAVIRGSYAHVTARKITDGTIDVSNGELGIKEMIKGNITSKNSSVTVMTSTDIAIRSVDDQYDMDEVNKLSGTKDFGDLRIIRVKGSLDLSGNTADIKVRNILPTASLIKIDNKYAAMELPVAGLTNYTVSFEGKFTKVQTPFPKQDNPPSSNSTVDAPPADAGFKAAVGDTKGAHTEFRLNCSTCTVDFK